MDTNSQKPAENTVPSIFDDRPEDPEAPYKMDKPRRNYSLIKGVFYILGTTLVIICIIMAYFLIIKPAMQNPRKSPLEKAAETIDSTKFTWKTYKMNRLWEFRYPGRWEVLFEEKGERSLVGISDAVRNPLNPSIGTVFVQVNGNKSDDTFDITLTKEVGSVEKGISNTITILEKGSVDGYPAVTYAIKVTPETNDEYTHSIVTLIKGPTNVNISGLSLKKSGKSYEEFLASYYPIHKQIVASLKFLQ